MTQMCFSFHQSTQRFPTSRASRFFGGRTSSELIRTGWQPRRGPAVRRVRQQPAIPQLRPRAPGRRAAARSRRLYAADFTADPDAADAEPDPVHGQCFGPGFSTAVDLPGAQPARVLLSGAHGRPDCAYADQGGLLDAAVI